MNFELITNSVTSLSNNTSTTISLLLVLTIAIEFLLWNSYLYYSTYQKFEFIIWELTFWSSNFYPFIFFNPLLIPIITGDMSKTSTNKIIFPVLLSFYYLLTFFSIPPIISTPFLLVSLLLPSFLQFYLIFHLFSFLSSLVFFLFILFLSLFIISSYILLIIHSYYHY